jgi:N-methylhydantoinase A/oxoprolinase/acetone carboxylase beta subunit
VRVAGPTADLWFSAGPRPARTDGPPREIWEPSAGAFVEAAAYLQSSMARHVSYAGPLVVEQRETTAVIGATDRATVDDFGNLVIEVGR